MQKPCYPPPHQNNLMICVKTHYPMESTTPIAFPVPLSTNIAPDSSGQASSLELELGIALLQTTNSWEYAGVHQK